MDCRLPTLTSIEAILLIIACRLPTLTFIFSILPIIACNFIKLISIRSIELGIVDLGIQASLEISK